MMHLLPFNKCRLTSCDVSFEYFNRLIYRFDALSETNALISLHVYLILPFSIDFPTSSYLKTIMNRIKIKLINYLHKFYMMFVVLQFLLRVLFLLSCLYFFYKYSYCSKQMQRQTFDELII